jgi:hypothetical protein
MFQVHMKLKQLMGDVSADPLSISDQSVLIDFTHHLPSHEGRPSWTCGRFNHLSISRTSEAS